jgi:hypothetical protein
MNGKSSIMSYDRFLNRNIIRDVYCYIIVNDIMTRLSTDSSQLTQRRQRLIQKNTGVILAMTLE